MSGFGKTTAAGASIYYSTQCYTPTEHRVFKIKTFARWSRTAGVPDAALCAAVSEMISGLIDADLGGQLYKKRLALPGRGKSGGARVTLGTRLEERWSFPRRVPEERASQRR